MEIIDINTRQRNISTRYNNENEQRTKNINNELEIIRRALIQSYNKGDPVFECMPNNICTEFLITYIKKFLIDNNIRFSRVASRSKKEVWCCWNFNSRCVKVWF